MDSFSQTVPEAEKKFAAACARAGCEPEWIRHPRPGPGGEPLHVGVAHAGATDAATQLVLISATHGIEGYAGSALQIAQLDRIASGDWPDDVGLLLVHLINPWGVAWNRREDDGNVDLFRNFHYCDSPTDPDPLYDTIMDAFAPQTWSCFDPERLAAINAALIAEYGLDRVVAAIRRGQHHRPDGMTYHGDGPCWSKRVLDGVIPRYLSGARHIAVIDIHTGFGPFGHGAIVAYDAPGSAKYQRLCGWFGARIYTPGADADTPTHSISPFDFIEKLVPGSEVTCGVLEYGTHEPDDYRDAFAATHYFHQYGDVESAAAQPWLARYREYLYPASELWQERVLNAGLTVIDAALDGLMQWAGQST